MFVLLEGEALHKPQEHIMSLSFAGSQTTDIRPVEHQIDNFGKDIVAVTFKYAGEVYTLNKKGKKNIKGYTSFVEGTYTLTNGTDKFLRMSRSSFQFVGLVYADGTVESEDIIL
jgi:hypothetical protein